LNTLRLTAPLAFAAALLAVAAPAVAGEGMWTFDGFPTQRVNRELGTRVDQAWLDRVRAGSAKLGGCSASFVSGEGLVLTNNHCIDTCKQQLSTPQRNYGETGFLPATRAEEQRCPGMTVETVTAIEDVTERVRRATGAATGQARVAARNAEIAAIEGACGSDAKQRCQVVDLYRGGRFALYRYRKFDDVRLAFAPEDAIANFGGDPDNFSFPRFSLDAAFVRAYENDRPAQTPFHLRWNASRPKANAPVFVVGNPGATQRLQTLDQLRTTEEVVLPLDQLTRSELRGRLISFAERSPENAFIAGDTLYGVENSYKRGRGQMRALTDARFMAGKQQSEAELRRRVAADARLRAEIGDPWADIAAVQDDYRQLYPAYHFLELRAGGGADLYGWARTLVRAAAERAKPNGERLPEFTASRLPATERAVLEPRPVHPSLDELELGYWLSKTREFLTVDDPQVKRLLGRESPEALAKRAIAGTKLGDPAERRRLWEGGAAAVAASQDPLIRLALAADADARRVRAAWEERVTGPTDAAAERIARARFAVYGTEVYPDATGTLRITYGRIEGWRDDSGRTIGPFTTFAGLQERATGSAPFVIPERWRSNRADPATVFNMTLSTDTIGGSSGSPALNAAGEVIGANFDSTFLTQRNAFGYDPAVNRSVIVTAEAITEALRDIYRQDRLVRELTGA
jgi:hypothetical protein